MLVTSRGKRAGRAQGNDGTAAPSAIDASDRLAKPAGLPATDIGQINAEIVEPGACSTLLHDWTALLARAQVANVAMHPTVAQCAAAVGSVVKVVLAWRRRGRQEPAQLVGLWVLCVRPLFRRWPSPALVSPVNRTLILGGPVIDRDLIDQTMSAMIDVLAADRSMPAIVRVAEFVGDGPQVEALSRALSKRGARLVVSKRRARPKLEAGHDPRGYLNHALSAKRRSSLRRYRRRLAELGTVEATWHRAADEVVAAFEEFLTLEDSGWKGRAGSSLMRRDAATPAFARRMIQDLAGHGLVTILAIRLDGRPVAIGVTIRSGGVVHTWKCAYDETLRSYGPGFLMMEDLTLALLADPSLEFADMSNNLDLDDGLAAFWTERHEVLDLLFETRRTGMLGLPMVSAAIRLRRAYRAISRRRPRPSEKKSRASHNEGRPRRCSKTGFGQPR